MTPPLPPRRPPPPSIRKEPTTTERLDDLEHTERDREAEHKRHIEELKHEHRTSLVSAVSIWRTIADEVRAEVAKVRDIATEVLRMQRSSELERLSRTENDAAAEARHRRRVAYAKVLVPLVGVVVTAAIAAIASHYSLTPPPHP